MQARPGALFAILLGAAAASPCWADENSDLELIPKSVDEGDKGAVAPGPENTGLPPGSAAPDVGKYYVSDTGTLSARRGNLQVPFPPPSPYDWQNRTSFDMVDRWRLADTL